MKQRSATSSEPQPEAPVFFVDRSLGASMVPEALRQAGAEVVVHDDFYAQSASDESILLEVGRRRWLFLTKDKRIRHRPNELHALRAARVRAFVVTAGNLRGQDVAAVLVKHLRRMTKLATEHPPPFWARITRSSVTVEPL